MYTMLFLHFFFFLLHGRATGLHYTPPTKKKNKKKQDTQGEKRSHGAKEKKVFDCSEASGRYRWTQRIDLVVIKAA